MTFEQVQDAVTHLEAAGRTVSTNAVIELIGGSKRDVLPLLRQIKSRAGGGAGLLEEDAGTAEKARASARPAAGRLTWPEVRQAAHAIRQARQANIFTRVDLDVTPERLAVYFDQQCRFTPPVEPFEVWEALRAAVKDDDELRLLNWFVEALRRQQAIFSNTREMHMLRGIWKRLFNA